MALHICTYDDLELFEGMEETRKPVHIGQYERLVCPACHKQFTAPKFSLGNMISCKFCGWTDEIDEKNSKKKV